MQRRDDPVGLGLRQDQAGRQDHVLVDRPDDHALLVPDAVGDLLPAHLDRRPALLVGHELDRGEQAGAAHIADDATLTVQTDHAVFEGAAEIRRMFDDFCGNSVSIFHEVKNIVVEPNAGKVATEQSYIGELSDGTKNDMHNCNFFDINADGQFTRVIIWMAGTNPLK